MTQVTHLSRHGTNGTNQIIKFSVILVLQYNIVMEQNGNSKKLSTNLDRV